MASKVDLEALYNAIEAESESAYGEDDELSAQRSKAIDRYLGVNMIPAPDGRSQVVDRSVYETIQWITPSLSRIFANGDEVCEVVPVGPEDEEGAKQEGQYLNYVIMERNNWVENFDTANKDALINKAGYFYAYKTTRRQIEIEKYERQTQEALALIMQDGVEMISFKEYPDDTAQPEPQLDPATGQPVMMPPAMLYDVEIRRTKETPKFCIEVLPPERCRVSKRCKTVQVKDASYFEYYDYPTISELRQDGIDVPDDVEVGEDPDEMQEETSRNQFGETYDYNPVDPAQRRPKTRWVWIRYDADGDGISELQYCIVVGTQVVHREEVNSIPIAVICPDPLPHRHVGLCPADTSADVQDIKTVILRGALDNLYLTNNARMFANTDRVNLDDLLVSRPGGVIRGKDGAVYGQDLMPVITPTVFPQAMEAYGFMEQVNEGRTGVNRYFQGTDQNALNKTSSGIQQLSTMAAQRVEQVARMYAPGIVQLFAILHEIILKSGKFQDRIKLHGKWIEIDPTTWRSRSDFRISVALAAGNKDALTARLGNIAMFQEKALASGLPIVTPLNAYETMMEMTKASDLSSPGRFWTDPASIPPKPPMPNPMVEVETVKGQFDLQRTDKENQTKLTIAQMQAQLDKYTADLQAEVKIVTDQHKAETDAIFMDKKHQQEVSMENVRGQTSAQLEHVRASVSPKKAIADSATSSASALEAMKAEVADIRETGAKLAEMLSQLAKIVTAPRVLERDKSGRATGSRVVLDEA